MKAKEIKPKVTIGMPVYNAEKTIKKAITSLLAQTFRNFELIISDNASDDETANICKRFALKDRRVHYWRQSKNLGASANYNCLLSQIKGKYFMFAAGDDWRSPEFLEANVFALDSNLKFIASTSPNCFEGEEKKTGKHVKFSLRGTHKERYAKFLQNAWQSHGIFYSLIRTETIKKNKNFHFLPIMADDWFKNFFLLSKGEINRTQQGLIVFGKAGVSMSKNYWKISRNKPIEFLIPLYEFSKYALGLMKNLNYYEWTYVFFKLLKVNLQAMKYSCMVTIKEFIK
jgi:glycosyltransferase involved in cell wall biosynthesis